jgi:hypothetical protein
MADLNVGTCANPACNAEFMRLGEGAISVFHVNGDSEAWGLPAQARQKVVWLCDKCCERFYVRLDRRRHTVHVVQKRDQAQRPELPQAA